MGMGRETRSGEAPWGRVSTRGERRRDGEERGKQGSRSKGPSPSRDWPGHGHGAPRKGTGLAADHARSAAGCARGEDVAGLTPRDVANRMEALGVVADAALWRRINDLRNRLAHEYPLDRARQTLLVNDAFAAIAPLLETLARAEAYVRTRLPEVAASPTARNAP